MYWIIGGDDKEYGPVTEEEVRRWIREGRADEGTLARVEGGAWKPLATFPEFRMELPEVPPPVIGVPGGELLQTNRMGMAGFIFGLLGLFCCGPIAGVIGLILSGIGLYQIGQEPERYTGRGYAIAGVVLSIVDLIMFAILTATGVTERILRDFGF